MITLAPISKNIQNTLMQKIAMMKKGQGGTVYYDEENKKWKTGETHIGTPVTETEGTPVENYMFTRTPWIRMTSFTPAAGTNNTAVVLMGTELGGDVARKGKWKNDDAKAGVSAEYSIGRMRSGFESRTVSTPNELIASDENINYQGLYNIEGEIPYRPISGIKDMSVDYKGGGMRLGATRTGEINWTSWDFEQLQNLTPHFLQHGKTVLLEWGWSGVGVLRKVSPIDIFKNNTINFDDDKILELNSTILTEIQKQNGHYDAMLGLIQNFTWTVRSDGGIDCTTNIIAPGVTLFQSQQKKMYANQFAMLPSIVEKRKFGTKNFWVVVPDMRTVLKTGKDTIAALAPYITFQEYMADFPQQILFNLAAKGLTWENAFGRIRTDGMGAKEEDPSIGEIGEWNGHQIIAPYKMNFKDKYVKASKKEPGFVIVTPSNQTADGKHFMDNYKLFLGTSL